MKKLLYCLLFIGFATAGYLQAQSTDISDAEILTLYDGLRVADVSDGLDFVGLLDNGLMHQRIEALWKDIDDLSHLFCGIAVTARYVPTNKVVKTPMEKEEFQQWEGNWYGQISSEPFVEHLKEGSVVVLDVHGDGDTGSVGSYNGLAWYAAGARGIVSNGGVRDTDELIKQKVPVYMDMMNRGRGIRPGRNEIESVQKPVSIGGVLVRPGRCGGGRRGRSSGSASRICETSGGICQGDPQERQISSPGIVSAIEYAYGQNGRRVRSIPCCRLLIAAVKEIFHFHKALTLICECFFMSRSRLLSVNW